MGLMDELGDFNRALELAAELGGVKPRPRWIRPKRPLSDRLTGRMANRQTLLFNEMLRMLAGGMYYVEPSLVMGEHWESE